MLVPLYYVLFMDLMIPFARYEKPSSFSCALRIDIGEISVLLISGTASR